MTKWTAQELLEMFDKETNVEEMNELYKALLAYSMGATEIDKDLDKVIDFYYNNDNITSFINEDIIFYAQEILN